MPFTDYALDTFVAPKLSQLTACGAPPLSDRSAKVDYWVREFSLHSMLRVRVEETHRQYIFNFLRRAEGAFHEYDIGRQFLKDYVDGGNRDSVSRYLRAVLHLEVCISQAYQAFMLARNLLDESKLFTSGDRSPLEQLHRLYNRSKHAENAIATGQLPSGGTLPIWITNDGLECTDAGLTFAQLGELLLSLSRSADQLSNPPVNVRAEDAT